MKTIPQNETDSKKTYPYVGVLLNLNGYSGSCFFVADGYYVITAKHMVTEDGSMFGQMTNIENIKVLGIDNENKSELYDVYGIEINEDVDIAILRLIKKHPYSVLLASENVQYNENDIFTGVGYGLSSTNPDIRPTLFDKRETTRLTFQNRIKQPKMESGFEVEPDGFYFNLSKLETYFSLDGAVDGEGIIGPGDSGGCAIIEVNGKEVAIGVFSLLITGTTSDGDILEIGFAASINSTKTLEWLKNSLPEKSFFR